MADIAETEPLGSKKRWDARTHGRVGIRLQSVGRSVIAVGRKVDNRCR